MAFPHWEYFLALDNDLERIARYIEFTEDNFATYSVELVRVILAAGSEIDVVAKSLCRNLEPSGNFQNIDQYRHAITSKYSRFPTLKITLPRYNLIFQPWVDWASAVNPDWWKAHTDVKHQRDSKYPQANLGNALSAVTGLFALLLYYYQPDLYLHKIGPWPKLLSLPRDHYTGPLRFAAKWNLPDFGAPPRPGTDNK